VSPASLHQADVFCLLLWQRAHMLARCISLICCSVALQPIYARNGTQEYTNKATKAQQQAQLELKNQCGRPRTWQQIQRCKLKNTAPLTGSFPMQLNSVVSTEISSYLAFVVEGIESNGCKIHSNKSCRALSL
jgi:hypothetical protein